LAGFVLLALALTPWRSPGSSLHKANVSAGGTVTKIELRDFLGRGKAGPEHQALARLIGSLVDKD
jgi:hypothetical protein